MTLQASLIAALDIPGWDDSIASLHQLVADSLREVDHSIVIRPTGFFNHSFVPDFILGWQGDARPTRDLFLRVDSRPESLSSDTQYLRPTSPVLVAITEIKTDATTDWSSFSNADTLVIEPAAIEQLEIATPQTAFARAVTSTLAKSGKGLVRQETANRIIDTSNQILDCALRHRGEKLNRLAGVLVAFFNDEEAARMMNLARLVWKATEGDPAAFPFPSNLAGVDDRGLRLILDEGPDELSSEPVRSALQIEAIEVGLAVGRTSQAVSLIKSALAEGKPPLVASRLTSLLEAARPEFRAPVQSGDRLSDAPRSPTEGPAPGDRVARPRNRSAEPPAAGPSSVKTREHGGSGNLRQKRRLLRDEPPPDDVTLIRLMPPTDEAALESLVESAILSAETYAISIDDDTELLYGVPFFAIEAETGVEGVLRRFPGAPTYGETTVGAVRALGFQVLATGANRVHYEVQLVANRTEDTGPASREAVAAAARRLLEAMTVGSTPGERDAQAAFGAASADDVDIIGDPNLQDDQGLNWTKLRFARDIDNIRPGSLVLMGSAFGKHLARVREWQEDLSASDPVVTLELFPVEPEALSSLFRRSKPSEFDPRNRRQ